MLVADLWRRKAERMERQPECNDVAASRTSCRAAKPDDDEASGNGDNVVIPLREKERAPPSDRGSWRRGRPRSLGGGRHLGHRRCT
jgi:hypothetical protein